MSRISVLVGFAEALAAPETVWSLVDEGFRVIAFARKGKASALRFSRHVEIREVTAPERDLEASLCDLREVAASVIEQTSGYQKILMPLDDKALYLVNKVELGRDWILAGPSGQNANLALNKYMQVQAAQKAGFNVPKTALARTAKEIRGFAESVSFPIILKAAECVPINQGRICSGGNWICGNKAELDRAVEQWEERIPLVAQRLIAGTGEGIFGLAAAEGVRAWSAHRRIRMMNPEGSGSSACVSQTPPGLARASAEAMMVAAGWRGLFMVELLRDHSGTLWFIELNGRAWGSLALSRRQGFEYPAWHVRLVTDDASTAGAAALSARTLVCRNLGRELMHILFVLRGARSSANGNRPSRLKTLWDILRVRRGDTFYNWRSDDRQVFFADTYYTIRDNVFKAKD